MEEGGEREGGGRGWGKVCFHSRAKEILMVNFTLRQTNLTRRQTALLFTVAPSPMTIHTIPEFSK